MRHGQNVNAMIEAGTAFLDAWAAGDIEEAFGCFDLETQEDIGRNNWSRIVGTMTNEGTLPKEWEFEDWEISEVDDGFVVGKITGWVTTKGLKKLELSLILLESGWAIEGFAFE
jgi:hypothetical protein